MGHVGMWLLGWWRSWASICSLGGSVSLGNRAELLRLPARGSLLERKDKHPLLPPAGLGEGSKFHREIIALLEKLLWQLPAPQVEFLWGKSLVRHTNSFPFLPVNVLCRHSVVLEHWELPYLLALAFLASFTLMKFVVSNEVCCFKMTHCMVWFGNADGHLNYIFPCL